MFFALVDDDRTHFDKVLNWTETNMAGGDLTLRLPGWLWGKSGGGEWKTLDGNSASDADLWMAYTLMEAGRLWHEPRYDKLGRLMAARIAKQDAVLIPGVGTELAPGPTGYHPQPTVWVVNPSYMPISLLVYMHKMLPDGPWGAMLEALPEIVGGEGSHGFAMDWLTAGEGGVRPGGPPVEPSAGVREPQAAGSYDAIRVYLWLGMADPGTPGVRELLAQVAGMAAYLKGGAMTPPLEVNAAGEVVHADAPVGFSAAVMPYLQAVGLKAQAKVQADRLTVLHDGASGLYGRSAEYYDQNLVLFSTGFSEQRFRFGRDGKLAVKWK